LLSLSKNRLRNIGEVVTLSTSNRIKELDGLRGIAILLVIGFHYGSVQLTGNTNPLAQIIQKMTYLGWMGVDLFFVLSGFLIGSILLRYKGSGNYFSTFYIRRIVRIIPVYFLLLLLYMLISKFPFFSGSSFLTYEKGIPLWPYFVMIHNFYMANNNNFGNSAIGLTWSIGIEEQFYIIFPFVVAFFKKWWLFVFLLLAIIAAPILRYQYKEWLPGYVLLQCRMDSLSFGALIAFVNWYFDLRNMVNKYFSFLIIIMVCDVIICFLLYSVYDDIGAIRHTLFALFFTGMLLIALTKQESLFARLLRNKLLTWVGTISYSLYLFHYIILGLLHFVFSRKSYIGITNQNDVLITFLALIISFLFSYLVYRFCEVPLVLFGKKFKY
jgi:peptidoglycan/LPS O-acetylase OafA/YrhL